MYSPRGPQPTSPRGGIYVGASQLASHKNDQHSDTLIQSIQKEQSLGSPRGGTYLRSPRKEFESPREYNHNRDSPRSKDGFLQNLNETRQPESPRTSNVVKLPEINSPRTGSVMSSVLSDITTPRGTPYWTPLPTPLRKRQWDDKPELTPFDLKMIELDKVKKECAQHLKKLNILRVDYMQWFEKKHKSFSDAIKSVQVMVPMLVPKEITKMNDFMKILEMCRTLIKNGRRIYQSDKLEEFYQFWMDFCQLKKEGDVKVYERICEYCESITRLREPEIKHKIDRLQVAVNRDFSEDFIFTDIHNEKDNLYIYKLNPPDHNLLGLVGILPYLLKRTTKLCYLVTKLHLEKE